MTQATRAKTLSDEIIEEIGNQTLARFGLNIFSLNTYAGYGAAVDAQREIGAINKIHANNDKRYGFQHEALEAGDKNIEFALKSDGGPYGMYLDENNKGNAAFRTDKLAWITQAQSGKLQTAINDLSSREQKLQELIKSGADDNKIKEAQQALSESKNAKIKLDFINETYTKQEQEAILQQYGIQANANDTITDIKVFENGEITINGQLKAVEIRNNSDLTKLFGKDNKYLNEDGLAIIITKDRKNTKYQKIR